MHYYNYLKVIYIFYRKRDIFILRKDISINFLKNYKLYKIFQILTTKTTINRHCTFSKVGKVPLPKDEEFSLD